MFATSGMSQRQIPRGAHEAGVSDGSQPLFPPWAPLLHAFGGPIPIPPYEARGASTGIGGSL